MELTRLLRHTILPDWWVRRVFSRPLLQRLESVIATSESVHLGELRLVVEGNLSLPDLWRGQTPRLRAIDLFSSCACGIRSTTAAY
jgi:hypothetical protein